MSIKRYDFDCITSDYLLGASLDRTEVADGDYVLHTDYAALLARHNALREAVAWERECDDMLWPIYGTDAYFEVYNIKEAARVEVDRLLGGE